MNIAVITSWEDKKDSDRMTKEIYENLLVDCMGWIYKLVRKPKKSVTLIGGLLPWAGNLPLSLYISGEVAKLEVYSPMPFGNEFEIEKARKKDAKALALLKEEIVDFENKVEIDTIKNYNKLLLNPKLKSASMCMWLSGGLTSVQKSIAHTADALICYTWADSKMPQDSFCFKIWNMLDSEKKIHIPLQVIENGNILMPPEKKKRGRKKKGDN